MLNRLWGVSVGLFLGVISSFAQASDPSDKTVYVVVLCHPEFPGGFDALSKYLKTNVQYSPETKKIGVKGRVFVSFIINTDGSISDVGVLKGLGYGCDEEAMRVVKAMPCWLPGSQSGQPIRVKYTLPITFDANSSKRGER